ncbi:RHS repeat domain-containing protein [Caulobacter mirabilis]|nr:RHS repeat domain-containing protein [Caulobacter mirabilis]
MLRGLMAATAVMLSVAGGGASAATVTYTYDDLGRLKTVTYSTGVTITYSYDDNGNRTATVTTT